MESLINESLLLSELYSPRSLYNRYIAETRDHSSKIMSCGKINSKETKCVLYANKSIKCGSQSSISKTWFDPSKLQQGHSLCRILPRSSLNENNINYLNGSEEVSSHQAHSINEEDSEDDTLPGTYVECTRCGKWRLLEEVHDPSEVSQQWHCGLQSGGDPLNACFVPEDPQVQMHSEPYLYNEFTSGSVVWAKMDGFPFWPAMVAYNEDGKFALFDKKSFKATHYYVIFLDPEMTTTKLLKANRLIKFSSPNQAEVICSSRRYMRKIRIAAKFADEILSMPIKERIYIYGYPHLKHHSTSKQKTKKRRIYSRTHNINKQNTQFQIIDITYSEKNITNKENQHNKSCNIFTPLLLEETSSYERNLLDEGMINEIKPDNKNRLFNSHVIPYIDTSSSSLVIDDYCSPEIDIDDSNKSKFSDDIQMIPNLRNVMYPMECQNILCSSIDKRLTFVSHINRVLSCMPFSAQLSTTKAIENK